MSNTQKENGQVTFQDGHTEHYNHGVLHRTDGPAVIWPFGTKVWYENGVRHRTDGPALVDTGGNSKGIDEDDKVTYQEWWIRGEQITEEQFNKWADNLEMVD